MATYLLDTNILIDAINGRAGRPGQLGDFLDRGVLLACTFINVTEIYMGMRAHEASAAATFLRELEFYPVTWEVARLAGKLFNEWRQRGHTLAIADVMIAAVCIANGITLVTDNQKHFPMPELQVRGLPPLSKP